MTTVLNKPKESKIGILLQIPIWIVAFLGLCKAVAYVVLSFTNYTTLSILEQPEFVGLQNYGYVLTKDAGTLMAIKNTQIYMFIIFVFCISAIVFGLFISKVKSIFGIIAAVLLSLCAILAILPSFPNYVFANGSYGFINSAYLSMGILSEPVDWLSVSGGSVYLIFAIVIIWVQLFVISYLFAKKGKKTLGVLVSLCAMPIAFAVTQGMFVNLLGTPSAGGFEWLPIIINNIAVNGYIGHESTVWVITTFLLLLWCAVSCVAVWLLSLLVKKIKLPKTFIKVIGYICFGCIVFSTVAFLLPTVTLIINNSFKPLDEILTLPQSYFVKRPVISNYTVLFNCYKELSWSLSGSLSDVWVIITVALLTVVPSAVGFAFLKKEKTKKWIAVSFLPLLVFFPYSEMFFGHTTLRIRAFLSGFGVVIVFLVVYALTKMIICSKENRVAKIIIGSLCAVLTTVFAATATVNFSWVSGYEPSARSWLTINRMINSTGAIRISSAFAGDILLATFTVVTAILPIILFFVVWVLYKKDIKKTN